MTSIKIFRPTPEKPPSQSLWESAQLWPLFPVGTDSRPRRRTNAVSGCRSRSLIANVSSVISVPPKSCSRITTCSTGFSVALGTTTVDIDRGKSSGVGRRGAPLPMVGMLSCTSLRRSNSIIRCPAGDTLPVLWVAASDMGASVSNVPLSCFRALDLCCVKLFAGRAGYLLSAEDSRCSPWVSGAAKSTSLVVRRPASCVD